MRAKRFSWTIACVIVVAVAALATSVASGASRGAASPHAVLGASTTYTDPAGDANGGPDVTTITVTNDDAGTVTMVVSVALPSGSLMQVLIDTNVDGLPDRYLGAFSLGSGFLVQAASKTDPLMAFVGSLALSGTDTTATLSFAASEVGIKQAFTFAITTQATLDQGDFSDFAGHFRYGLTTTPPPATTTPAATPEAAVKPVIGAPVTRPAYPQAGKRFTVSFPVVRSDGGAPLTNGTMICDPSVAGKVITHAESFKNGTAKLSFVVPKTAKGKALKVRLTIKSGGQSATKVATFKVR